MLLEKLQKLGAAASWDSCGAVKQKSLRKSKIPAKYNSFVHDCSGTSESCRLFKALQSNSCTHDCRYCINSSCRQRKVSLKPQEVAQTFVSLAGKNYIQGLFLSSGVAGNAERAGEKMIESARLIRREHGFRGYIHLKVLPTMPKHQIEQMAELADRLSLNLEAPSKSRFSELGSTKQYKSDLEKRLKWIDGLGGKSRMKSFTTQFVLGAAGESDAEILGAMDRLYESTSLWRTYFSAFEPVKGTAFENRKREPKIREHRLYQADWLLRVYGFKLKEVKAALNEQGNLSPHRDVKIAAAVNTPEKFPVDVNNAGREELLKVPGIGPVGADRILKAREQGRIRETWQLKECGVIAMRALPFVQLEKERQLRIEEFA